MHNRLPIAVLIVIGLNNPSGAAPQSGRLAPNIPIPSDADAIRLVRDHKTNGYVTVAQTLAYAEQSRQNVFRIDRIWTEQRAQEPFRRVYICYWLRPANQQAQSICGIQFRAFSNPSSAELVEPLDGISRDLQHSREKFVRSIDHEVAIASSPAGKVLHDAFDRLNPYDWR